MPVWAVATTFLPLAACGIAAAWLFVFRRAWLRPLIVAVAAVLGLFILTFVQPALWIRVILDTLLVCSVGGAYQSNRRHRLARPRVRTVSPT